MRCLEFLFVYILGGLGYGGLEMLWRGRTHWTMLLLGGGCFVCIYLIETKMHCALPLRWLFSAAVVTVMEFCSGCLVNLWLHWNVWDYSALPGNLLGQVCPYFMLLWFLLAIPCCALARLIQNYVFELPS